MDIQTAEAEMDQIYDPKNKRGLFAFRLLVHCPHCGTERKRVGRVTLWHFADHHPELDIRFVVCREVTCGKQYHIPLAPIRTAGKNIQQALRELA